MYVLAKELGAFVRWLFKGCKTKLRDEIEGNFEATWGVTYDMENYIIGNVTVLVMILIAVIVFNILH
ncbi:MAG TPA: hypothetical protein PL115_01770 [Bacteroidales bacterium]|jgi:hypothetical protein|nr:hypothetical protein [Bacteroidales bacterium]HPH52521.1 hypothetical protein [Bacteroidales bacterium]HPY21962.1 hypothetical protein [Bacteroidales bacterium]HQN24213.1 hypothetical protein [Bacteroidales bacterium]HQP78574.1 hypothetical protein [Bacteroidales bacterium]